ncbi:MAG: NADH-quinone oxidoreductase subunit H [Victivallaceae bacterium]|nr:NADH-quinone oxidoreductase subunit H [Victivallaceae bacterium]
MDKWFNLVLLLLVPPLLDGIINRVKSFWGGRMGPPLLQPFFELLKLLRKGEVISSTTTFVFRGAPAIALAAVFAAALTVPLFGARAVISFEGDFVVFAYLLALSRFGLILSALDTGSSFEGMGSSREALFAAFAEPGFLVIVSSLACFTGCRSFAAVIQALHSPACGLLIAAPAAVGLFILMLAEGCRIPVDDPATHLELTMIHEVMILDNSGPGLAFILYGSCIT